MGDNRKPRLMSLGRIGCRFPIQLHSSKGDRHCLGAKTQWVFSKSYFLKQCWGLNSSKKIGLKIHWQIQDFTQFRRGFHVRENQCVEAKALEA
jgi:hypothetical protein